MHNIFCIHVGQCGLQVGFALWELLVAEHAISRSGVMDNDLGDEKGAAETFFNLSVSGQYVPRGIFVDLEPTVVDQMRMGVFRGLYHPDQLISGYEDAANNFARGFHTVGRIMKRACENRIRKEFELNDRVQTLHIYRSLGGGTGSGMTATIFEVLLDYAKLSKIEIPIHPSPHLSCAIVEPYNCILSEHFCMEDIDISVLIDNEALYDIIINQVDVREPNLHSINRLIAQVCSSLTASSRFENELYNDFTTLTNLVPYPRIHFPLVSYAPFGSEAKLSRNVNTVTEITRAAFDTENQLVKCDPVSGKYMSCSLVYRGAISPTEVFNALAEIKASRLVRFVDWCPTGFKVGIVNQPPQSIPDSKLGYSSRNVVMMTNSSSVSALWHRLAQKFHKLYAKRSFVHWFVAEGLEESEFCESLYNLATLAKDYEEVALDTKFEDGIEGGDGGEGGDTAAAAAGANGEGGAPTPTGGEDGGGEMKKEAGGGSVDASEDDDDEENENVSNVIKTAQQMLNHNDNRSIDWRRQFEKLLSSLYTSREFSELSSTSKSKQEVSFEPAAYRNCCHKPATPSCTECTDHCNFATLLEDSRTHQNLQTQTQQRDTDTKTVSDSWHAHELYNKNISNQFIYCRTQDILKLANKFTGNGCDIDRNRGPVFIEAKKKAISSSVCRELHSARIMCDRESTESSLLSCTPHPSVVAQTYSLSTSYNMDNSITESDDSVDDEAATFSLMEDLIRKTSFSQCNNIKF